MNVRLVADVRHSCKNSGNARILLLKNMLHFLANEEKIFKKPAFHFSAFGALAWHHIRVVVFELYIPLTFFLSIILSGNHNTIIVLFLGSDVFFRPWILVLPLTKVCFFAGIPIWNGLVKALFLLRSPWHLCPLKWGSPSVYTVCYFTICTWNISREKR